MSLICRFRGHEDIPVKEVGLAARPGGILPSLDGYVAYTPDDSGPHNACLRCRRVTRAEATS
jgi:hypothetical protein